jgi:hypothetical protein
MTTAFPEPDERGVQSGQLCERRGPALTEKFLLGVDVGPPPADKAGKSEFNQSQLIE